MMSPGADAADVTDRPRHLFYGPTFTKFFKTAQVLDMKLGIGNIARIVQGDGHPAVTFDPGYWLDVDHFAHAYDLLISPVAPAAPSGCRVHRYIDSLGPVDRARILDRDPPR